MLRSVTQNREPLDVMDAGGGPRELVSKVILDSAQGQRKLDHRDIPFDDSPAAVIRDR